MTFHSLSFFLPHSLKSISMSSGEDLKNEAMERFGQLMALFILILFAARAVLQFPRDMDRGPIQVKLEKPVFVLPVTYQTQ